MEASAKYSALSLNSAVFLCGAIVMIYEITGSRIVSPFIGTSTYVWTSLIGTILGALSFGYWLGGRMADKHPDVRILAGAIFFAGGAVSVTILLKEVLLSAIGSAPLGIGFKAVLASLFLFAPASVLLGFVTPYAAKLRISSLDVSGRTVGRLYALSTIGSIVGTFAAGFVLIPFVGSVRTLYLIAALLFAVSLSLAAFSFTRANITIVTLFILAVSLNEMSSYYLHKTAGLNDIDTEYSRVQIFRTTDPRSGRPIQAMAIDPYFTQSAVFLDSDELVFDYNKYYDLAEHFKPGPRKTLMIGGAGYTYPKHFAETFVNSTIDVVEIDPKMTEIAGEFFRLKSNPRLKSIHEDGRVFLNSAPSKQYDAVLMDAFTSLFTVPHQLTTIEAVREIDRILADDGVVIFNVGSALTGEGSRFFQAEFKTYQQIFPRVLVFKVNREHSGERLQNLIIVACKSANKAGLESSDPAFADLLSHIVEYQNDTEIPILTDDLAPVEYYNSLAQNIDSR